MKRVRDMSPNEGRWHGDVSELIDKVWGLIAEDIRCETVRAEVGRSILSDLNAMRNMNPYDTHELHSGHEQMILKNTGYRKPYDNHDWSEFHTAGDRLAEELSFTGDE